MLNWVFLALIVGSVVTAAFTGTMPKVTADSMAAAKSAVDLAIGLIGQMALWLGFMRVLQDGGLMTTIASGLKPVMRRVFPDVPADHPAMGAMIMNIAANMLGLGNAATPFGLKAMVELDKLNRHKGVATNSMALFLVINTSGVAMLPLGVVAVRAALKSGDPAGIIVPSILATAFSTIIGVSVAKFLERRRTFDPSRFTEGAEKSEGVAPDMGALEKAREAAVVRPAASGVRLAVLGGVMILMMVALWRHAMQAAEQAAALDVARGVLSDWLLPVLMASIALFGFGRQVKVYESFVAGAKEGFHIAVAIIPFLVAILVAIGMFRASGAMDAMIAALSPLTGLVGMPAEALPMAIIRPLSGSGALGVMTATMEANGPDSFVGYLVSVMNGSTETTFYVLAVYFGAVGVRAARHTVFACLSADAAGVAAALALCHIFFR